MLRGSYESTLSFLVNDTTLLILDNKAPELRLVVVTDLLHHLVAINCHFLVNDVTWVNVVLDKFLDSSELQMLVHQLWHEVFVVDHLKHILLDSSLFASD